VRRAARVAVGGDGGARGWRHAAPRDARGPLAAARRAGVAATGGREVWPAAAPAAPPRRASAPCGRLPPTPPCAPRRRAAQGLGHPRHRVHALLGPKRHAAVHGRRPAGRRPLRLLAVRVALTPGAPAARRPPRAAPGRAPRAAPPGGRERVCRLHARRVVASPRPIAPAAAVHNPTSHLSSALSGPVGASQTRAPPPLPRRAAALPAGCLHGRKQPRPDGVQARVRASAGGNPVQGALRLQRHPRVFSGPRAPESGRATRSPAHRHDLRAHRHPRPAPPNRAPCPAPCLHPHRPRRGRLPCAHASFQMPPRTRLALRWCRPRACTPKKHGGVLARSAGGLRRARAAAPLAQAAAVRAPSPPHRAPAGSATPTRYAGVHSHS
jgi:hypothetical protein